MLIKDSFVKNNKTLVEWRGDKLTVNFEFSATQFLKDLAAKTKTKLDDTVVGVLDNASNMLLPEATLLSHGHGEITPETKE